MPIQQRISPFLWFDGQAEEAALMQMTKLDVEALKKAASARA
jgi:predicted 3-demethylubiquinone-9 3-methyltransferase (glyoxalase superfamily)